MRYAAAEKLEIIRLVEQSPLPVRHTLAKLGIPRATFYRWYDRHSRGGPEALNDRSPRPDRVWNRIHDGVRQRIIQLALDEPALSPRAGGAQRGAIPALIDPRARRRSDPPTAAAVWDQPGPRCAVGVRSRKNERCSPFSTLNVRLSWPQALSTQREDAHGTDFDGGASCRIGMHRDRLGGSPGAGVAHDSTALGGARQ